MSTPTDPLAEQLGGIDIYLVDQLLRGRIRPGLRVLDAGCGGGRNLVYLLRSGYQVYGVDESAQAIQAVRELAARLAPELPPDRFRHEPLEAMSFPADHVDVVVASAVLHLARDEAHFHAMLGGCFRVLRPGGLFFARLASTTGLEGLLHPLGGRRYRLPDGAERFLVDPPYLERTAADLGTTLADPLKTTLVHGQRSMTTWVLWKVEETPGPDREGGS
jgi:SAM-dependent methyltransferase